MPGYKNVQPTLEYTNITVLSSGQAHSDGAFKKIDELGKDIYRAALDALGYRLEFLPTEIAPESGYGYREITVKAKIMKELR